MVTHIVAKTIVLADDGRVLLLVRADDDKHRPGGYDLPGGTVRHGELPIAGAAREAKEEVGLVLDQSDMRLAFATAHARYDEDVAMVINIVWLGFVARFPADAKLRLGREHSSSVWMSLQQAAVETDSSTQRAFFQHMLNHDVISGLWADA